MHNRKVNLFVVGAMKAGTTSFNEMLSKHPDIYFSPVKEPHYFVNTLPRRMYDPSRFFSLEIYFEKKFPEPLHITNIENKEQYQQIFSLAKNEAYLAEGSTGYLHAQESAEKIFKYNPNAKIIILLRDPLKRAHSHYKMDLGLGRTKNSFQEEINIELKNFKNSSLDPWGYINMSLYAEAIQRYKVLFNDNVHVISLESLIKEKGETMRALFQFLEVDNLDLNVSKSNASSSLKFQKAFYFLKQMGLKDLFSKTVPIKYRQMLFQKFSKKETTSIALNEVTIQNLQFIFETDQQKINNL